MSIQVAQGSESQSHFTALKKSQERKQRLFQVLLLVLTLLAILGGVTFIVLGVQGTESDLKGEIASGGMVIFMGIMMVIGAFGLLIYIICQLASNPSWVKDVAWWDGLVDLPSYPKIYKDHLLPVVEETLTMVGGGGVLAEERRLILTALVKGASEEFAKGEWSTEEAKAIGQRALQLVQNQGNQIPIKG